MSDRKGQDSRWSSVREREERERQRAAQREAEREARLARERGEPVESSPGSRRLSDGERLTIRKYQFPSADDTTAGSTSSTPSTTGQPAETSAGVPPTASGIGTKWRDSAPPPPGGTGPVLPNLPGDDGSSGRKGPGNARLAIFGIGLFAAMLLIYFLPFGPFGGSGGNATPTPSATLPSILDEEGDEPGEATRAPEAQAEAGQAIVCIDPGHGGLDTGWNRSNEEVTDGMGPYSPPFATEAEINLGMSWMLRTRLEDEGNFVVMTRETGTAVNPFFDDVNGDGETRLTIEDEEDAEQAGARDELQARINICNEAEADILISVHVNGFNDASIGGYEVFYTAEREFGEQNELLATLVYRQMDANLRDTDMGATGRGADPDTSAEIERYDFGTSEHYIMTGPDFEQGSIEASRMPGIIVECAFLSNDRDAVWLIQADNQQLLVDAYAKGIADYFDQYPPS